MPSAAEVGLRAARARTAAPGPAGEEEAARLLAVDAAIDALVEGSRSETELAEELRALAGADGRDAGAFRYGAFSHACTSPLLERLAPRSAAKVVLQLLRVFAGVEAAALWLREADDVPECVAWTGRPVEPHGNDAAPVARFERAAGLLVTARGDAPAAAYVEEASVVLARLLERDLLLERNAERERAISASLEKRLSRLAFDLHDGVLQDLAALGADVALLRRQLAGIVPEEDAARVDGRFQDLAARLAGLDATFRDVLRSLQGGAAGLDSLDVRVTRELEAFSRASGLGVEATVSGSFVELSESRRIAIFRIVQEALANVREHSGASRVAVSVVEREGRIEVAVEDDGRGFDLRTVLASSLRLGRFGLVGMRERVRLLGGDLDIRTLPGKGTRVSFSLDPWSPPERERDAQPEALV